jgi:NADH-quinone oxidoreductase subunit A
VLLARLRSARRAALLAKGQSLIVIAASGPRAENSVFLSYHAVLVFLITGVAMVCTPLILGALFRPRNPYPEKTMAYECAEDPSGPAQIRFDMRFYSAALIFIIFDVEVAFMFPWAYVFHSFGDTWLALMEGLAFILILFLGLVYVWVKGDVDWNKTFSGSKRRVQG